VLPNGFKGAASLRPYSFDPAGRQKIHIYTGGSGRLIAPVSGATPSSSAQFKLVVTSDALPSSDQRWRNQVDALLADLKRTAGEVRQEITPVNGQKGGAQAIILALGSSGAITAALAVFRAWLSRSADRSIEIEGKIDGREVKLKLTGRNIDETTIRQALKLAGG